MSSLIVSKHFMERFFERVLKSECTYCRYDVLNKMQEMKERRTRGVCTRQTNSQQQNEV